MKTLKWLKRTYYRFLPEPKDYRKWVEQCRKGEINRNISCADDLVG